MEFQFQETLAAKTRETPVLSEDGDFYRFSSNGDSSEDSSPDEEIWEDASENQSNVASERDANNATAKTAVEAISMFILLWQACYGVPGSAIAVLLRFVKKLIGVLGDLASYVVIKRIADSFPVSLKTVRSLLGANCENFTVYAACPKCYALYSKERCTKTLPDGRVVSKTCSNVL